MEFDIDESVGVALGRTVLEGRVTGVERDVGLTGPVDRVRVDVGGSTITAPPTHLQRL